MASFTETAIDTLLSYGALGRAWFGNGVWAPARTSDRRLLLLVNEFAPAIAGGVYRPAALARYATSAGWTVHVITGPAPAAPSEAGLRLLSYVGPGVAINRYSPSLLQPSYRLFPQVDGGLLGAAAMVDEARRVFGRDLPRTIVATGPAFSSFVAGYMLARRSDRQLVLEYRDEWSECPFDFVVRSAANRVWESRCLRRADRVVVTTESQRRHLNAVFGAATAQKCVVVPNGWEPAEASAAADRCVRTGGRVALTFAGKLGGHTDPGRFLATLQRVLEARPDLRETMLFRFVGAKRDDARRQLDSFPIPEVIEQVPVVPLAEAARLMRESSALLLFHDRRFERYLPGKLYEYVASGTPVLLMDDAGESDRLVRTLGVGWSLSSDDAPGLERVLQAITERHGQAGAASTVGSPDVAEWLAGHTREALVRRFLEALR